MLLSQAVETLSVTIPNSHRKAAEIYGGQTSTALASLNLRSQQKILQCCYDWTNR